MRRQRSTWIAGSCVVTLAGLLALVWWLWRPDGFEVSGTVTLRGRPAQGVTVRVERREPRGAIVLADVATDSRGRFRAQRLAAGTYVVLVARPDGAVEARQMVFRQDAPSRWHLLIELAPDETPAGVLQPGPPRLLGRTVLGRVQDDAGQPVVNADLALIPMEGGTYGAPAARGRTDAAGAFRLDLHDSEPDSETPWLVLAWAVGYEAASAPARNDGPVDLVLRRGALRLEGRVVRRSDGAPLAGARVVAVVGEDGGQPVADMASDADGRFACASIPPGGEDVHVWVTAPGYRDAYLETVRASSELLTAEVVLEAGHRLRGRVLDARTRQPVAGARVQVQALVLSPRKAVTDAAGLFEIVGVPPDIPLGVRISTRGYEHWGPWSGPSPVMSRAEPDKVFEFLLEPGLALIGRVRGPDGEAAAGAVVFLACVQHEAEKRQKRAEADGTFRLDGLSSSDAYDVEIVHPSGAPERFEGLRVDPDRPLEVQLTEGGGVEGEVRTTAGQPVAEAGIFMVREQWNEDGSFEAIRPEAETATSTDGGFAFVHLPAGNYRMEVRKGSRALGEARFPVGEHHRLRGLEVLVPADGAVRGTMSIPATRENAPRRITLIPLARSEGNSLVRPDEEGPTGFAFHSVPPGAWRVEVRVEGLVPWEQEIQVLPGRTTFVELGPATAGAAVLVRAVDSGTRQPIAGTGVDLYRTDRAPDADLNAGRPPGETSGGTATTGPDGLARLEGLERGRWRADVWTPAGARATRTFSLDGAGVQEIVVEVGAPARLRMVLLESTGLPAVDVMVHVVSEPRGTWQDAMTTGDDGVVEFPSVPPGRYRVTAVDIWLPPGTQDPEELVELRAGETKDLTWTVPGRASGQD